MGGTNPGVRARKPATTRRILREVRRVLDVEIEALNHVRANAGHGFADAVAAIHESAGKVVVTGVGKSGIIASKIASTLTSTGTPAVFLHASEALHGDVGIVSPGDVVIAIGKSGESTELTSLITVLRRTGIKLIGLTGAMESTLGREADIVVDVGVPREACPLNLAPTASTTAALAAGDAIAISLMKLKEFSPDQFARHHPGGQLGRRLTLTVADAMRKGKRNPVVSRDGSIKKMLITIAEGQAGAVSVVDAERRLVGIVTDFDIRRVLESEQNLFDLSIEDLMNPRPLSVRADRKAVDAMAIMSRGRKRKRVSVLPVTDPDGRVVGIVHLGDLVAAGI
jgi:arabinose-5-phosphate isomerase